MRVEDLKFTKCMTCGDEIILQSKRHRFCGSTCRSAYNRKIKDQEYKLKNELKYDKMHVKRDLFGFAA